MLNDEIDMIRRICCWISFFAIVIWLCRYRLTFGCNDKLQLGSVISTFTRARSAIVAAAK
ncbi:putative DNA polymerase III, clamp loader complex, gamma/delta/delta subunit [Helianthus annuus]|nr:putative DNA polymerase III, clamp loader complex, gamma/delta/delta subunit [Helianthus annuus]